MDARPLDPEVLDALAAELEDPEALARLVRGFLDQLADHCEEVVNAADAEDLAAAARALTSAGATVGAVEVTRLATELGAIGGAGEDAPPPLLDELLHAAEAARVALEARLAEAEAEQA